MSILLMLMMMMMMMIIAMILMLFGSMTDKVLLSFKLIFLYFYCFHFSIFKGDGLPIGPFTEVLFKQLFESHPKIIEEAEAAYTVAMIQEMFYQIDYNDDGKHMHTNVSIYYQSTHSLYLFFF